MCRFSIVFILFITLTSAVKAQDKPNIVLFFIDDWAWNGSTVQMDDEVANSFFPSVLQMPNLEKLAAEGMIFSNAYAGAPQCSPSRVALQTGQSSPRNGFTVYMNSIGDYYDESNNFKQFPVVPNISDMTIDTGATTIPEALVPHDYASAHIGKWHMRGHPDDEGYMMNDGPTTNNEGNQLIPDDPKLMFSITDSAIVFIEEQVSANKPFYLQLSHYAMHAGSECLAETRARYQAMPELKEYYRSIGETAATISRKQDPATWLGMADDLDGRIGAVIDTLKQLGIYDHTYIIVTGDNGYRHGFYDDLFRLPQPLHGGKWWLWQGGLRVPMVAKGPDIPAGSVCDENVVNYDFLPTFVEWAGGDPLTELTDIDGKSLASLMRGEAAAPDFSNRSIYFHYPHYRTSMPHSVVISGDKKVIHFYEQPDVPMYFDLANDMAETSNMAETDSAGHRALFDDMMNYFADVGARIPLYPNPDYDSLVYAGSDEYDKRILWGPFKADRDLEDDEYISAKEKLYQHLGAIPVTISTDESGGVLAWHDQTHKENHAVPDAGTAYYPSEQIFESGLAGVDFGSAPATFELISALESDSLLDFEGPAAGKDGFAFVMALKPDSIHDEWCTLVGNSSNIADTNSFGIRYNGSGIVQAYLGGEVVQGLNAISKNQTAILAMNYHCISGMFDLVTSLGDTLSIQVTRGDFSNSSSIYLGGIGSESGGFYDGLIGDLKVYDLALSKQQVYSEADALLTMWTEPAEQELIQHLDASVEESVIRDESGLVSNWLDLSGKENHGNPLVGALYYPASVVSETGLPGVDFGSELNKLELFSREESDAFLDFTGLAAKNNGVTIFLAFKIDDFLENQNDIIGNSTSVSDVNGFGMRYDASGKPRAYVGGEKIALTHQLQKNETVIYAVNYNKSGKVLKFWNSSTGSAETTSLVPGDFSNGEAFSLGGTGSGTGDNRYLVGMVGEVKVFNHSLSETEFGEQCIALADKWIYDIPPEIYWLHDTLYKSHANTNGAYSDHITGEDVYIQPENTEVIFSKISGPEWLQISESGELTGTPSNTDKGENSFVIQVEYDGTLQEQVTLLINVGDATYIDMNDESGNLTIYPNPASEVIKIKHNTPSAYYQVIDIIGNRVMAGKLTGNTLYISQLKPGLYMMQIDGYQIIRFIKE
jgi:arylsulfatase A-like enzyme